MGSATAKKLTTLHAYKSNKDHGIQSMSSFLILEKWETWLNNGAVFQATDDSKPDNNEFLTVQEQLEGDFRQFRTSMLEETMSREAPRQKEQLVQSNQLRLIRLIDAVCMLKRGSHPQVSKTSYEAAGKYLLEALLFLEEFFPYYLDENCRVPQSYMELSKGETAEKLSDIKASNSEETKILVELISHLIQDVYTNATAATYREWRYIKTLLAEISLPRLPFRNGTLRDRLYYLNFNEESFVFSEFERFAQLLENKGNKSEKIAALRLEQKHINQLPVKLNCVWGLSMPSLKDQINGWINEEINFLESGQYLPSAPNGLPENADKIHTSLSVAKLAVIIRLLVIDKIIINRAVSPMLRGVAKVFTTLQKDEISSGSLETKYHAPDKVTIIAVKDMLFKWINILSRLEKQF